MTIFWLANIYFLVLGSCLGSFCGVLIHRLPLLQSVLSPRSYCDFCQRPLKIAEIVPILSFFRCRGRSQCCQKKLSRTSLLCEILLSLLSLSLWHHFGLSANTIFWLLLSPLLLALVFLDIHHFWLPDALTNSIIGSSLIYNIIETAALHNHAMIFYYLSALASKSIPALLLWGLGKFYSQIKGFETVGWGDVKLLWGLGLALPNLEQCLAALMLAACQGVIVGSLILYYGGHRALPVPPALAEDNWQAPKGAVPFGPFIILGGLEILLVPPWLTSLGVQFSSLINFAQH